MTDLGQKLRNNLGFFEVDGYMNNRAGCCSGTKSFKSITVYLPIEWTDAFEHDIEIVKQWIDVVQEALGHRKIELVENKEGGYTHPYPRGYMDGVVCKYNSYAIDSAHNVEGGHSNITRDEFYKVIIPAGTRYQNYFTFVLLRHLYSYHYVPLVRKALEIRPHLTITNNKSLTAILFAYLEKDYIGYYGVCAPDIKWRYKYVNPVFDKDTSTLNYGFMNNYSFKGMDRFSRHSDAQIAKFWSLYNKSDWKGLEEGLYVEELKRFPDEGKSVEVVKDKEKEPVLVYAESVVAVKEEVSEITSSSLASRLVARDRERATMVGVRASYPNLFADATPDKAVAKEDVPVAVKAKSTLKKTGVKRKLRAKKAEEAIIIPETPKKKLLKKKKKAVTPVVEGVVPVKKKVKKLKRKTVISNENSKF